MSSLYPSLIFAFFFCIEGLAGDIAKIFDFSVVPEPPTPKKTTQEKEFADFQLRNLKRIVTLGVGGFGRVELVRILDSIIF